MKSSSSLGASTIIVIILAGVALLAGGWLIAQTTPSLFPPQASAEAQQVDALFQFMLVLGGFVFLLVQALLVYSIVRFRARPDDMTDGTPMHGNTTLEIVWTAIPAVVVFVIAVYSYQVWVSTRAPKDDEMVVHVQGQRFNWAFTYSVPGDLVPGDAQLSTAIQEDLTDDNQFTITSNELHTYVGRPVKMEINADDVNHAFWVPSMRIKQDALVGRTTEVRFTPTLADTYPVVCAELCGAGHGAMAAIIVVHENEEAFQTWLNGELQTVFYPPEDPVARGEQVLASNTYPCSGCHALEALGWTAQVGPNLTGVGDRAQRRVPGQSAWQYMHESIQYPGNYLVPGYGNVMPAIWGPGGTMSPEDLDAIVSFLCAQTATGESACPEVGAQETAMAGE